MYIIGFSKVYKDILWLKAIFYKTPIGLVNWEKNKYFLTKILHDQSENEILKDIPEAQFVHFCWILFTNIQIPVV